MKSSLAELGVLLTQNDLIGDNNDIICITETWINDEITDAMLCLNSDFAVYRKDRRGRAGGGVCVFVKRKLKAVSVRLDALFDSVELVAIDYGKRDAKTRLICVYKPPNLTAESDSLLYGALESLCSNFKGTLLVVGDFNLPGIIWPLGQFVSNAQFENFWFARFAQLGLHQMVIEPSRGKNFLDIVLTSDKEIFRSCCLGPPFSTSDHFSVISSITCRPAPRTTPDYKKGDYRALSEYCSVLDWDLVFSNCHTVTTMWSLFKEVLLTGISRHVPPKRMSHVIKKVSYPVQIRKLLSRKIRCWRVAKRSGNFHIYNQLAKEYRAAVNRYNDSCENEVMQSGKLADFYKYVKTRIKARSEIPPILDENGSEIFEDQEKSELFNSYFASVFTVDNGNLPNFPKNSVGVLDNIPFTIQDVYHTLRKLPNKLSRTPDCLPAYLLRRIASAIAYPIYLLFQKSIETGELPDDWKIALVCPIFKKGRNCLVSNYRPVSQTSYVSISFEKIFRKALLGFFSPHLSRFQHGFRSNRSTVSQMLECLNDWTSSLQQGCDTDAIYLDFATAFDTVSHQKLLFKLETYGVTGKALQWIKAFLSGRTQRVYIGSAVSTSVPVSSSVPQGTVLGPTLFIIFINDIADCVLNSSIRLFADDAKLYKKIGDRNVDPFVLQADLARIVDWSNRWQLRLSKAKCKTLCITNRRNHYDSIYSIDNHHLEAVTSIKDLGYTVSSNLKFSQHCAIISAKALRTSALIFRVFRSKSVSVLLRAYKVYVRPIVESGSPVWNPHLCKDIDVIEKVQRYFTRRIFNRCGMQMLPYSQRLVFLDIETLERRRIKTDLLMCYKIKNRLIDLEFDQFFEYRAGNTRGHSAKLIVKKNRINARKYFFSNRVVNQWNSLTESQVTARSLGAFKRTITAKNFNLRFG